MSRYCGENVFPEPILEAAERWKTTALISDGSIFANEPIWGLNYLEELESVVEQLDNKEFYTNLEIRLKESKQYKIIQLAAEVCWLTYLCPSKKQISESTKRNKIRSIWECSGNPFPKDSDCLTDDILGGIGHTGQFFVANYMVEWMFFIRSMIALKKLPSEQRIELLSDGWNFAKWLENIPECEKRTVRHMILFLLFPDNFERIFSGKYRKDIVGNATKEQVKNMSVLKMDRHIFEIRKREQERLGTTKLDFYHDPLKGKYSAKKEEPDSIPDQKENDAEVEHTTNLILYGPPGTGKTYELNKLTEKYSTLNRKKWLTQQISQVSWFDVIFATLYDLGKGGEISEILKHEYVRAKKEEKSGTNQNINSTIGVELVEHSKYPSRGYKPRTPCVFSKNADKVWSLAYDWEEECQEQVKLAKEWKAGPNSELSDERFKGEQKHDQRFKFVTFHQAYSYEDFIEGLRPVQDEETGNIKYEIVSGVFKSICDKAKKDPEQRYAIFIDEINRGNIASIFGELITLIETDKRVVYGEDGLPESGMTLTLPYSGKRFGVPHNLDVYGTMNTADRSIALLDTALRRRFQFREMMPDTSVIEGSPSLAGGLIEDGEGGTIDLRRLLETINRRIRFLLGRDMTIGHSYFIEVRDFIELKNVLLSRVIPLLQEYFYDDWHRIQLVFRDVGPSGEKLGPQIIRHVEMKKEEIIGFDHADFEDSTEYSVEDKITPDAIRKVYEKTTPDV